VRCECDKGQRDKYNICSHRNLQISSTLPFDGSLDIEGDSEGTEDGVNST